MQVELAAISPPRTQEWENCQPDQMTRYEFRLWTDLDPLHKADVPAKRLWYDPGSSQSHLSYTCWTTMGQGWSSWELGREQMEKTGRPKKVFGGVDKWSTWVLIALFVVGVVLILVDAALMAGFLMQSSGISLWGWLAEPTPVVAPTIQIAPAEGVPGVSIAVAGQGWRANEPLVVNLEDSTGVCPVEVVATPNAGQDGRFGDTFVYPSNGCWVDLSRVLVTARSLEAEARASAEFRVLALPQTPTPTLTWTPVIESTAVVTSTPVTEPTATPVAEPTFTATPTPVVAPTSTPTPITWPTATPTPAIVDWRGEYFDNASLTGMAVVVRNDKAIDFDWGYNAPATGLPVDGFSARWTRALNFEDGLYSFRAVVDDGIRLYVDGDLLIDQWRDGGRREVTADRRLTAGRHTLRVEYYERSGVALAQVRWEKVTSYPDWKGEYWPNLNLQGNPAIARNDAKLDFDWKQGSPGGAIPADGFSARWTRQASFDAAVYRFRVLADDGIRLWVDGQLLIDKWQDQHPTEYTADRTMVRGAHSIKVEYYEHTGGARVKVWWEKVAVSYPDWKGEYWPNRDLSGGPSLVRNDKAIDFNWGTGAPATGLPADNLSARWTRQVTFQPGIYRFYAWADDGVRAALGGQWIINEWHDARDEVYSADLSLNGTTHQVTVEYYERGGNAGVRFWWTRMGDLPTPVPAPKVQFSSAVYTADEGSGMATITVLLNTASDRAVTVDYATSGGTATPGSDYGAASGTLTFAPGVTSRTFTMSIVDDTVDEADETVALVLSNPGNAQLGTTYQAALTIVDNDAPPPPPEVRFSAATYGVDEGAGTATITVILSTASDRTVTVDYATAVGTASAGSDYAATNGTLTFSPGATSRTFAVSIVDDGVDETDETVALVLSNAVYAQLGTPHQATLTIVDDDEPPPLPEVRFSAATYSVGEGAGAATIAVVLSGVSDGTVTVDYATSDGTARAGSDYTPANGTLTFAPGVTSRAFTVSIVDDGADEEDETVALALSSPTNAVLGAAWKGALVIIDDDTTPPAPSSVRLNEILPAPGGTDWDGNGTADELDEWIELYNAGTAPINLSGWLLDDAEDGSAPYPTPAGVVLEPGAFLVLYRQKTGIVLDDGGDTVRLLDASGQAVDAVTFGAVGADASYNRSESGSWYVGPLPSPGAPNIAPLP
jgi:hypothetical protein